MEETEPSTLVIVQNGGRFNTVCNMKIKRWSFWDSGRRDRAASI